MRVLLGVLFHSIGGFAAGSFYMPFKKVKGWAWESYWIIGGLFSWLFIPMLAASLTIPGWSSIIVDADRQVVYFTFLMGICWGIGGLTYGLGIRYLGMSLGNSIILGFCSTFGALVPSIYYDLNQTQGKETFTHMLQTPGGRLVLLGVLICLVGIGILGKTGMIKEAEWSAESNRLKQSEFKLTRGLTIAVISGILSAFFNFGIEAGKPMAISAVEKGSNPLFQNNVIFVVLLWGGLLTNLIWSISLNKKNKTYEDYVNKSTPIGKNILFSAMAGTTWFMQFFFYGMGESKLGNGASSWILHMATIILTGNLWGLYLKEWSGVSARAHKLFITGLALMMASIFLVGIGNSM